MRLYHREGAGRPPRVAWMLEEVGEDYDVVRLTSEQTQGEEHRRRHPLGRVPVVDDGEGTVYESAAICLQIADLHPSAELIPPLGSHARGLTYQWAVYAMAELEPPAIEMVRQRESDPDRSAAAAARFQRAAAAVAGALAGHEYLVEDRFTVADLIVASVLAIARRVPDQELLPQALESYIGRLYERPARRRALAALA